MSSDYDQMPQRFREAFHRALVNTLDWITHGGPEPKCSLEDKSIAADAFFDWMIKFDQDQLSEADRQVVLRIIGGVREDARSDIERDPSYGNAAKQLVRRIAERKAEIERRK